MDVPRHPTVIRRSIESRLSELGTVKAFVKARLKLMHVKCGEPTCHCAAGGEGHPSHYLVFTQGGKPRTRYVQKDRLEEVQGWVQEHTRVKRLVQEISDLHLELLASEAYVLRQQKRRQRRS